MNVHPRVLALLLPLLAACGSAPSRSDVEPGNTPEEIAERFLEARRRGDEGEVWSCFIGVPDRKQIYRSAADPHEHRTWEEFVHDFEFGWANAPLAPADVWQKVGERDEGGLRVLTYTQGTEDDPIRGRIDIATLAVGRGWLIAWVGRTR